MSQVEDTNHEPVSLVVALLSFFLCFWAGFILWGQAGKALIWFLIILFTAGLGGLPALIDYWMCYAAQQKRPLESLEFFPR